jgi:hypothetical protein
MRFMCRSTFNGGRVEFGGDWDGYASEDSVRAVVKHRSDAIFEDGEWIVA